MDDLTFDLSMRVLTPEERLMVERMEAAGATPEAIQAALAEPAPPAPPEEAHGYLPVVAQEENGQRFVVAAEIITEEHDSGLD